MRYIKLALLFAIAATPAVLKSMTEKEMIEAGILEPKTEAQKKAARVAKTTGAVNAEMARAKIDGEPSAKKGDTSKVAFVLPKTFAAALHESMWAVRKHIKESGFGNGYTNTYINSRKNINADNFIKKVAEVYFCLKHNGIQHESGIATTGTKNTTYEFIQKAESVNPATTESNMAMKMVLTLVANNEITPEEGEGKPLHQSLSASRATALKALYDKYDIAYLD